MANHSTGFSNSIPQTVPLQGCSKQTMVRRDPLGLLFAAEVQREAEATGAEGRGRERQGKRREEAGEEEGKEWDKLKINK